MPAESSNATGPRERTADRLLTEAAALFSERGYDASTTRELAERLGITKASLYHHISGKDDLLYGISTESLRRTSGLVRAVWENAPSDERLQRMVQTHLESTIADRDLYRVAMVEMRRLTPARRREITALRDDYARMFTSAIRQDQADGRIRADLDSGLLTLTLLGLLNWPVFWFGPGGTQPTEQLAAAYLGVFLGGTAPSGNGR